MTLNSWRRLTIGAAALLATAGSELAADSLFMGANVWRAKWNVGVADKQSENATKHALYSGFIANTALQAVTRTQNTFGAAFLNAPADADLTNYGLFGAYNFGNNWSLSFNLTYGQTEFGSSRTSVLNLSNPASLTSCGASCFVNRTSNEGQVLSDVSHRVTAERKDLDAVLARRLGDSGFAIFGGIKAQDWTYAAPFSFGPSFVNGQSTDLQAGTTATGSGVTLSGFEYEYRSQAIGPAAGLSYTYVIDDVQALSAQVGGIFLFGTLNLNETSLIRQEAVTVSAPSVADRTLPGNTIFTTDEITDRLRMPGFTAKLDYRYKIGNVVLRAGVFYQETRIQSRAPNDNAFTVLTSDFGSLVPIPSSARAQQPEYSVDGARDVFQGVTFSASTQIF